MLNAACRVCQPVRHELLVAHGRVQPDAQQSAAVTDTCAMGKANSRDTQGNRHMKRGEGCYFNKSPGRGHLFDEALCIDTAMDKAAVYGGCDTVISPPLSIKPFVHPETTFVTPCLEGEG